MRYSFLALAALSTACMADAGPASESPQSPPAPIVVPDSVSYVSDIQPLMESACVGCHKPQGIAPFALTSYAEVKALAALVKDAVVARRMPPWPAARDCATYLHDASLTDLQIATIARWVDLGAPEGSAPATSSFKLASADAELSRIDRTVRMRVPHVPAPPEGEVDEHRCFLLDWPETRARYLTAFHVRPGNAAAVHHLVGKIIPPEAVAAAEADDAAQPGEGYRCNTGDDAMGTSAGDGFERRQGSGQFAAWVPGAGAIVLPEGTGLLVRPGSKLLLDMHYNTASGDVNADQTSVDLTLEDSVPKPAIFGLFSNPRWPGAQTMNIPARQAGVTHEFSADITQLSGGDPLELHYVAMHMHELGTAGRLSVERGQGGETCALDIPAWDFHWQLAYRLAAPIRINRGDKLKVSCTFDNSQGTRDVNWGEDTGDEMCIGMIFLTKG